MAFILKDRVRETTTTTGTGALTLAGVASNAEAFSDVCSVGDTFWYAIVHSGVAWETGIGTYSATNTLTRTTVLESSNSGSAVSFTTGTKDVFITLPASKSNNPVSLDVDEDVTVGGDLSVDGSATVDGDTTVGGDLAVTGGISWNTSNQERQNSGLSWIWSSKAWADTRRGINQWATGFKGATDTLSGIVTASSLNYTLDSANGLVKPTVDASTTGTFAQASHTARGIGVASGAAGFQFTAPESGTLSSVVWDITSVLNAGSFESRIYSDNSGSPGTLLATSAAITAAVGDTTYTFSSPPSLTSGTTYWVVLTPSSGSGNIVIDTTTNQAGYGSGRNVTISSITDDNINNNSEDWRVQVNYSTGTDNMTVVTTAQTADSSVSNARVLIVYDDSDSPTLNSDLTVEVTCDGGDNWTTATLSHVGSAEHQVAETADTECTAGTSYAARIKTLNGKDVSVYGVSLTVH